MDTYVLCIEPYTQHGDFIVRDTGLLMNVHVTDTDLALCMLPQAYA